MSLFIIISIVSYVTLLYPSIEGRSLIMKSIVTSSYDLTSRVLKYKLLYFAYRLNLFY